MMEFDEGSRDALVSFLVRIGKAEPFDKLSICVTNGRSNFIRASKVGPLYLLRSRSKIEFFSPKAARGLTSDLIFRDSVLQLEDEINSVFPQCSDVAWVLLSIPCILFTLVVERVAAGAVSAG